MKSSKWEKFKAQHEKVYKDSTEELERIQIWMNNKDKIDEHNKLFKQGQVSFQQEVNKFSDKTSDELVKLYTGLIFKEPSTEGKITVEPTEDVPIALDWRSKGAVTEVKNQGDCASCYAFSAIGSVESQYFLNTGKLVSLSEQQIIACDREFNYGCYGGGIDKSLHYIADDGGIETEKFYPYTASHLEVCRSDPKASEVISTGVKSFLRGEGNLLKAVATYGPISVSMQALKSLFSYKSGVYDDPKCGAMPNHAVLVVGYGNEDGKDYWLVKNSWGKDWGEEGYVKMVRNKNLCGLAVIMEVPTGVKAAKTLNESKVEL